MTQKDAIKLFEDRQVRSVWDSEAKKWYISIIDAADPAAIEHDHLPEMRDGAGSQGKGVRL